LKPLLASDPIPSAHLCTPGLRCNSQLEAGFFKYGFACLDSNIYWSKTDLVQVVCTYGDNGSFTQGVVVMCDTECVTRREFISFHAAGPKDDVAVVTFNQSEVKDENGIRETEEELFHLVEMDGWTKIIVSLDGVEFFSSSAIGMLDRLRKRLEELGGQLRLAKIIPVIYEVFAITKLNRVFVIRDEESDALATFV